MIRNEPPYEAVKAFLISFSRWLRLSVLQRPRAVLFCGSHLCRSCAVLQSWMLGVVFSTLQGVICALNCVFCNRSKCITEVVWLLNLQCGKVFLNCMNGRECDRDSFWVCGQCGNTGSYSQYVPASYSECLTYLPMTHPEQSGM